MIPDAVKHTGPVPGTTGIKILQAYNKFKKGHKKDGKIPDLWDGKTAERIIEILLSTP